MDYQKPKTKHIVQQVLDYGYVFCPISHDNPHDTIKALRRNAVYHGHKISTRLVDVINNHEHSLWVVVTLEKDGEFDTDFKFEPDEIEDL